MHLQKKSITAFLLCIVLVIGTLFCTPVTAYAADGILPRNSVFIAVEVILKSFGVVCSNDTITDFIANMGDKVAAKELNDFGEQCNILYDYLFGTEETNEDGIPVHNGGGFRRDDGTSVFPDDIIPSGNYTIDNSTVNNVYNYFQDFIYDYNDYILFPTLKPSEIEVSWFSTRSKYDTFVANVNLFVKDGPFALGSGSGGTYCRFLKDHVFLLNDTYPDYITVYYCDSGWNYVDSNTFEYNNTKVKVLDTVYTSMDGFSEVRTGFGAKVSLYLVPFDCYSSIYTADGAPYKIYKTMDAYKNSTVSKSNIYYSSSYYNYSSTDDHTVEFNGSYYNNYTEGSYYNNVQTIVTDSYNGNTGITAEEMQTIIQTIFDNMKNDTKPDSGSGGDTSGGDSGGGSGGETSGVKAIIEGIGKLLDALLVVIGKVLGLVSDFVVVALNLITSFTAFSEGFAQFLASCFAFLPPEIISLICAGLSLIITLAVIKYFKG